MLEIQLYINNQRVDTFKDESVSLTDSIQNVRDIDKVFTSFSQSFNLPASKTNNKIFKHFYNWEIDADFSFDARQKVPANIELNSLPFRAGFIQLTGVELKDNVPYSYKVTFFGEIVKLKDAVGEGKLSDLNLSTHDRLYNATNILAGLQRTTVHDVVVPLITHTQRLYYDSTDTAHDTGNLAPSGNKHGVYWNQLKYALRVNKIIEAIELTYPNIEFTNDFFKNTSLDRFNNLYMWVSRKSGAVENLSANTTLVDTTVSFGNSSSLYFKFSTSGTICTTNMSFSEFNYFRYVCTPDSSSNNVPYNVSIFFGPGVNIKTVTGLTGTNTISLNQFEYSGVGNYFIVISTTQQMSFTSVQWQARGYFNLFPGPGIDQIARSSGPFQTAVDFQFNFNRQMPEITIVDFLSGLFKTFNLTAFVQADGKIKVQPLDDYYNDNPKTIDITEYVGIDKSNVNSALPYRQVKFEFKDTKSFLANKFGEINQREWGKIEYNDDSPSLSGSLYRVESPFGHFLFERLTDIGTATQKSIQWGYSVDKSQNAYLPQPLLFYPNEQGLGSSFQLISVVDQVDGETAVSDTSIVPKCMPFNTPEKSANLNPFQLNFQQEVNEWTADTSFSETLFSEYYESYIRSIFNPKQRITSLTARLPLATLLTIEMKDRLVVAGRKYKINKITTNLSTGESQLELINDI